MPSLLESISQNARFMSFPVTDGDSSRRPENIRPPPASAREVNWHRTMTMDERYACRWRNLIGQGIAKLLDKPEKEKYCLQSFPEGYCMFDHHKGPISNIRHDLYLHGSKTVLRFRSPAEFIPHGYWLLTDPTLNPKNCGCKYCGGGGKKSQTEISESLGLPTNRGPTSVTGPTGMRTGGLRSGRGNAAAFTDGLWVPPDRRQPRKIDAAWATTTLCLGLAANTARISDLRSRRRFRQGELVWCVRAGEIPITARDKGVDHESALWPAMVVDHGLETSVLQRSRSSGLSSSDTIVQRRMYYLHRLGASSLEERTEYNCVLHEDEILPWYAHSTDSSSAQIARRDRAFLFALKVAENFVKFWAVCDRLPIKVPAPASLSRQARAQSGDAGGSASVASSAMLSGSHPSSIDVQSASARSTPSLSIPYPVDPTPPQRSPARLVPPGSPSRTRISRTDSAATASSSNPLTDLPLPRRIHEARAPQFLRSATVTETRYQGLWYGAERIWTGDLVRLCPEREAFAKSLRLSVKRDGTAASQHRITPSPGALTRGVVMRVDRIFARIGEARIKECVVAGPLYEIAPADWTNATEPSTSITAMDLSRQSSSGAPLSTESPAYPWDMTNTPPPEKREPNHAHSVDLASFPLPPVPPGYTLRALLPSGSEISLPISFISGRYYPDLFQWPLFASILSKDHDRVSFFNQLEPVSIRLQSLCALAAGKFNHAVCVDVKLDNRTGMLEEAIHAAQAELRRAAEREESDKMKVD